MSNLLCFISFLALALPAADYFFSLFDALIDRLPSLSTLPRSYIFISSLLFVIAYKLSSAMPNLFSNYDVGGLFISAFADDISSRIMSRLIDHFPSFKSNRGHKNGDQMNSGQRSGGKLNNSQSSEGQINGDKVNTGHNSGGQMNGVQMNGGEMYNGKLNCRQDGGQSLGVQMNGVQMNRGKMKNRQLNIIQSEVAKANIK
ncbi:hypothetical protein FCM35_KLT19132 [Carex littledalei]|uniref:Uncharacterized protein n=1 Tax=Carex littledalei TaxID=544730 RepID=A0A833RIM3_9POAL|nr:hypothetical protein FCM35_KLT19132 [Carex littledalei]